MARASKVKPIAITVAGIPPVKSPSIGGHGENKKRKQKFEREAVRIAKETGRELELYGKCVRLTIVYHRYRGNVDAANIIGGVADALEGPFYRNDRQITEVRYKEDPSKKKDEYTVGLESAGQE